VLTKTQSVAWKLIVECREIRGVDVASNHVRRRIGESGDEKHERLSERNHILTQGRTARTEN